MQRPDHSTALVRHFILALATLFFVASCAVWAGEAAPASDDPVLEKRVTTLSELLRCLVCQNQTIADSHAELAIDLKNQIREKLRAGESEKQIIDYMVARYGDFVLYKPPVKATTVILWVGPFILLLGGVGILMMKIRGRIRQAREGEVLSEAERARAATLLEEDQTEKGMTR